MMSVDVKCGKCGGKISTMKMLKPVKDILKHLSQDNIASGSEILAGKLAIDIGRYDFGIQIAKKASRLRKKS